MKFRVYGDKGKTDLVCDIGTLNRVCNVSADGSGFSVDIISFPPAGGYSAYLLVLQYDAGLTLQQQDGLSENRHPTSCTTGSETKETGSYHLHCVVGLTAYAGALANVQFECPAAGGKAQIDIVGGTGAGVSAYVHPTVFSTLIFLSSKLNGDKQVADSVVINCLPPGPAPMRVPTPPAPFG